MLNNIKDHTEFDIGSIFAQHFPNKKEVVISVSDFGLGIPDKVRELGTKVPAWIICFKQSSSTMAGK